MTSTIWRSTLLNGDRMFSEVNHFLFVVFHHFFKTTVTVARQPTPRETQSRAARHNKIREPSVAGIRPAKETAVEGPLPCNFL